LTHQSCTRPTQIVAAKALADDGSKVPLLLGVESDANIARRPLPTPQVLVVASPLAVNSALADADRTQVVKIFAAADPNQMDQTYVGRGRTPYLAVAAIEKAGSTDGEAVRDALVSITPYNGPVGGTTTPT